MPLSPYKKLKRLALPGGGFSNNTGVFPDDITPGDELEIKYEYEIDFTEYFGGFNSVGIPLEVRMEIRGAPKTEGVADGDLILAFGFKVSYQLTTLFDLFTYYAFGQKITITFPDPPPAELGDPAGIAEPGGGSGYGLGDLNFQETFETPIFKVAIPKGATLKVTFHTAGFPALISIASVSVRTRLGASGFLHGFRHPADGEANLFYSGPKMAQQTRAIGRERALSDTSLLDWKADGTGGLLRAERGALQTAIYDSKGDILARMARDDGRSYGEAMVIYPGKTLLGVVRQDNAGPIVFMQDKSGVYIGYGDRSGGYADPVKATLPADLKLLPGILLGEKGGQLDFFFTDAKGDLQHIQSVNDGLNWT